MTDELTPLVGRIADIIQQARGQIRQSVNSVMVASYWEIGRLIVEHEQQGQARAAYGKRQLAELSTRLTKQFGKGFDASNLRNMRRFHLAFPIREAVSLELSWSHYNLLARLENPSARQWYAHEAISANWSVRALERQIGVLYYERLLSSKLHSPALAGDKSLVTIEAAERTAPLAESPKDFLRNPYILDFLNQQDKTSRIQPINASTRTVLVAAQGNSVSRIRLSRSSKGPRSCCMLAQMEGRRMPK